MRVGRETYALAEGETDPHRELPQIHHPESSRPGHFKVASSFEGLGKTRMTISVSSIGRLRPTPEGEHRPSVLSGKFVSLIRDGGSGQPRKGSTALVVGTKAIGRTSG